MKYHLNGVQFFVIYINLDIRRFFRRDDSLDDLKFYARRGLLYINTIIARDTYIRI